MNTFLINTLSIVVLVLGVSCSNHNKDHDHDQHVHSAACNHNEGSNENSGLNALTAPENFENIHVEKLYSDSLATAFVIWAKQDVKAHKHLFSYRKYICIRWRSSYGKWNGYTQY